MSGDSLNNNDLPFLFAPAAKQDLLPAEVSVQSSEGGVEEGLAVDSCIDKFGRNEQKQRLKTIGFLRTIFFNVGVLGLGSFELGRDWNQGVGTPGENAIWNQHVGIEGLLNDHMGDMWETILAFYALLGPVEIASRLFEKMTDKKVDPAVKVLATSIGAAVIVGVLEMNPGMSAVSEIKDAIIGPLIGVACINLSRLTTDFVVAKDGNSKLAETVQKASQAIEKISNLKINFPGT